MAIVKVDRFNLFIFDKDRNNLTQELQKFKYVHFDDLSNDETLFELGLDNASMSEELVEVNEEINKVNFVIDTLSVYDDRPKGLKALKTGKATYDFNQLEEIAEGFNYNPIYENINEIIKEKDRLIKESLTLEDRIKDLKPWINLKVSLSELHGFRNCNTFLGVLPKKYLDKLNNEILDTKYTYLEVVSELNNNIYIFVISEHTESDEVYKILVNNGFALVDLNIEGNPQSEVEILQNKLKSCNDSISNSEERLKEFAKYLNKFEVLHDYLMNKKLRLASSVNFLHTGNVNVIKGYIPSSMKDDFINLIKNTINLFYLDIEEVEKDDINVPILLENSTFSKAFEPLTTMYSLPKYNEIDPTPLLAFFYMLFFGMMVADLGYGLLLFIGTFIALKFFNLNDGQRNSMRFFLYGSVATMFWGIIYGSFFGGIIQLPALIDPGSEFNLLLILSIALGGVHIFFALGIKAYMNIRDKNYLAALFDVGFWYMALGGAIVLILTTIGVLSGDLKRPSLIVMVVGMAGIVLTNGRDAESIGGKLGGGLYSLYGISGYIGDFVSYSRLMALGLSGAFIASSINLMVKMLFAKGLLGIIGGILVFIIGQVFNLFLSLLSGYVHSIRLTFVEFFGKFYEGGGRVFELFQSDPKYINIK